MHKNTNWLMEVFEQTLSLQKGGDVKVQISGTVADNFIERNEIFEPNVLINFKAIFNAMRRTSGEVKMAGFELELFNYTLNMFSPM